MFNKIAVIAIGLALLATLARSTDAEGGNAEGNLTLHDCQYQLVECLNDSGAIVTGEGVRRRGYRRSSSEDYVVTCGCAVPTSGGEGGRKRSETEEAGVSTTDGDCSCLCQCFNQYYDCYVDNVQEDYKEAFDSVSSERRRRSSEDSLDSIIKLTDYNIVDCLPDTEETTNTITDTDSSSHTATVVSSAGTPEQSSPASGVQSASGFGASSDKQKESSAHGTESSGGTAVQSSAGHVQSSAGPVQSSAGPVESSAGPVVESSAGTTVVESSAGTTVVESSAGATVVESSAGATVVASSAGATVVESSAGTTTVVSSSEKPILFSSAGTPIVDSSAPTVVEATSSSSTKTKVEWCWYQIYGDPHFARSSDGTNIDSWECMYKNFSNIYTSSQVTASAVASDLGGGGSISYLISISFTIAGTKYTVDAGTTLVFSPSQAPKGWVFGDCNRTVNDTPFGSHSNWAQCLAAYSSSGETMTFLQDGGSKNFMIFEARGICSGTGDLQRGTAGHSCPASLRREAPSRAPRSSSMCVGLSEPYSTMCNFDVTQTGDDSLSTSSFMASKGASRAANYFSAVKAISGGAVAAAGLSAGAIAGIAIGATVGGVAVVGAAGAVGYKIAHSKSEEPETKAVPEKKSKKPQGAGPNVMDLDPKNHVSLTARSAPVAV